jgi:hypothetical protein
MYVFHLALSRVVSPLAILPVTLLPLAGCEEPHSASDTSPAKIQWTGHDSGYSATTEREPPDNVKPPPR